MGFQICKFRHYFQYFKISKFNNLLKKLMFPTSDKCAIYIYIGQQFPKHPATATA
jgi:sulfur relay (sulfurtransferase) DsrC/TusE family protein